MLISNDIPKYQQIGNHMISNVSVSATNPELLVTNAHKLITVQEGKYKIIMFILRIGLTLTAQYMDVVRSEIRTLLKLRSKLFNVVFINVFLVL